MKDTIKELAAAAYSPPERTKALQNMSYSCLKARVKDLEQENSRLMRELEQVKQERDGMSIMLTSATSTAETYKRERDAAISDMERLQGLICQVCKEYYQPDPQIREYSCKIYGEYFGEIAEDGLLCCSEFKWRGVKE